MDDLVPVCDGWGLEELRAPGVALSACRVLAANQDIADACHTTTAHSGLFGSDNARRHKDTA